MSIDSAKVLYNKVGNDENMTPDYGVRPILKYVSKLQEAKGGTIVVWCPFDLPHSEYVKQIGELDNVEVVHSHLLDGKDFFKYEPDKWDIIVSNPPFKNKRLFFERALDLDKPFALLMTLTMFNDNYPAFSFYERGKTMQLLKFNKRIKFTNPDGRANNKITFQSGYICCDFLPSDLIIEALI
jgi:hypothetical protein